MSTTILIPVSFAFIRNNEGALVLHPSIKLIPSIEEDNGCIRVQPQYVFTEGDGYTVDVHITKENIDDHFDSYLIFTGFSTTALKIIKELNVPEDQVEWVR